MTTSALKLSESTSCLRCGTCCLKGGPGLHFEDLELLQRKTLTTKDLYTLRIGEPAHDQAAGKVVLLTAECIKIRSAPGETKCLFYRSKRSACDLYTDRPLECRALKCWDIADLVRVARMKRVSRLDITGESSALGQLTWEHEARCGCADLLEWLREDSPRSRIKIQEARDYDMALRSVLVERGLAEDGLLFLLGRPLDEVLQGLVRWISIHPFQEN